MTTNEQTQKIAWCIEMLVTKKCGNKYLTYREARSLLKRYALGEDKIIIDKDELIRSLIMALRRVSLIHYSPKTAKSEARKKRGSLPKVCENCLYFDTDEQICWNADPCDYCEEEA